MKMIGGASMQTRKATLAQQINYSIGGFGSTIAGTFASAFILYFYAEKAGLDPRWVGLALLIGRIWDAVTDPAMGSISDSLHLKMGRRKPWITMGAIPLAIFFVALFTPPEGLPQFSLFLYLLVIYIGYSTFLTIVTVPLIALGGDLSMDYNQRTKIAAIRLFVSIIGTFLGGAGLQFNGMFVNLSKSTQGIQQQFFTMNDGFTATAMLFGLLTALSLLYCGMIVSEPARVMPKKKEKWKIQTLGAALVNKNFMVLLSADLFYLVLVAASSALGPFLIKFRLFGGNEQLMNERYMMLFLPTMLVGPLALPLWPMISKKLGKKNALGLAFAGLGVACASKFFLYNPDHIGMVWIYNGFQGFFGVGMLMIGAALIPDIGDEVHLQQGKRNDGAFFGIFTFGQKLSGALGAVISGFTISWLGLQGAETLSAQSMLSLRVFSAFVPAVACFVAMAVFMRWFTLTQERVYEIQAELAEIEKRDLAEEMASAEIG
jgi:Na+/melibiose symporter-like transporter